MGFPDNTDLLPYMMESGEVGFPILIPGRPARYVESREGRKLGRKSDGRTLHPK